MALSLMLLALIALSQTSSAQQCTPGVSAAASCTCGFNQCESGEICDPNTNNGLCTQAPAASAQQCTPGVPAAASCPCALAQCDVGEICDPNKNHGFCTLAQQCPAGQAAQGDCQCAELRCQAGDRCDPNASNGQGACAKESQLSQCPQGQLAAAYCLCGTEMCSAGLQCNNGKCDLPSGPISACAAPPQLAASAGCLCGSEICTQGDVCYGSPQHCVPACSTNALANARCHCGGSEICEWNQLCLTQNGIPKCVKNWSSGCATDVSQCSNPTAHHRTIHGGRDVTYRELSSYSGISKQIISLYLSLCRECELKKAKVRKSVVVTKFVVVSALERKTAIAVAEKLKEIFAVFGAPRILQSDNGKEFANQVVKELVRQWPECRIVHGKPKQSQSQGSVERANRDRVASR